ncbi:MAG: hypothetical protein [Bacteriophage sp.]|nr:MAG: hypothetical protein [Bacteriophage sp.]
MSTFIFPGTSFVGGSVIAVDPLMATMPYTDLTPFKNVAFAYTSIPSASLYVSNTLESM